MTNRRTLFIASSLFLCAGSPAYGQTVSIRHAVYIPAAGDVGQHVEVVFGTIFHTPAAVTAAEDREYRLIDLRAGVRPAL